MPKIGTLMAVILLGTPVGATAVDRFVNPNATCPPAQVGVNPQYNTIQDTVDASSPGDVVLVCAGTYQESVAIAVDDLSLLALPPVRLEPGTTDCISVA